MKLHFATHASSEPVLGSLDKALLAIGRNRKSGQAPCGGLGRQLSEMLDATLQPGPFPNDLRLAQIGLLADGSHALRILTGEMVLTIGYP